ncbi:MAG: M15 family metallopeptidase [Patescibacteria group bacterium]
MDSLNVVPIHENGDPLVDLAGFPFVLEPVYFQEGISREPRMFLRKSVVEKLLRAERTIARYRLKIWDAYRTRTVQDALYERFWNTLQLAHPDWSEGLLKAEVETYVSNAKDPLRIPHHATGGTVDLTLVDGDGRELDMGTPFDHFGLEAEPFYFDTHPCNDDASRNRKMLREALEAEGFVVYPSEWWHFDYGNQRWALEKQEPYAFFGEITHA